VPAPPILVLGGGVIGLSVALELRLLGLDVVVLERSHCGDTANGAASPASAGMLGFSDPHHPPQLRAFAEFSYSLYPEFLDRIEQWSGRRVPLGPTNTLEALTEAESAGRTSLREAELHDLEPELVPGKHTWFLREEPCLDPRLLCAALLAACRAAGVDVRENEPALEFAPSLAGMMVRTEQGVYQASQLVLASGAWTTELTSGAVPTEPRRGQMLLLQLPHHPIRHSIRAKDCYLVPRADGLLVGSTVERTGFDASVQPSVMAHLHAAAAEVFPSLTAMPRLDEWAGLRPGTPDDLPIVGPLRQHAAFPSLPRSFACTGHFRNGILLAPGTARVMAQLLQGKTPAISLANFSPARFSAR
jgi:glycine oxidase